MTKFRALSGLTAAFAVTVLLAACDNDNKTTWEEYADWRNANEAWLDQQATLTGSNGSPLFTKYVPPYNKGVYLLQRTIGDTNNENLTPLYTSTVKVNYQVHLYNDTLIDRGTNYVCGLSSTSLIDGWSMALMNMHVGDSTEVLMPYIIAYGPSGSGSVPPYSALRFNLKLVDIIAYEVRP